MKESWVATSDTAPKMPEALLEIAGVTAAGSWSGRAVNLAGTLRLDEERVSVAIDESSELELAEYSSLSGATWSDGTLTLFRGEDSLGVRGPRELNRAWGLLLQRACEMPEMTRGLRGLGRSGGDSAIAQQRFFEPLLLARRALQEAQAPEFRVRKFEPAEMIAKLRTTTLELAAHVYPESPPDRRALEAEFEDYLEPLVESLEALRKEAAFVESSEPHQRFTAWREWTRQLRRVFMEADRSWAQIARSLKRSGVNSR